MSTGRICDAQFCGSYLTLPTEQTENRTMKRETIKEVLFFVLLVACASQLRVVLQYHQNIAPVAAVALFAGYFFRSWRLALWRRWP